MCLPPIDNDPSIYFSEMKKISNFLNLKEMSMGMSEDYLKAIENSSTYLRILLSIGLKTIFIKLSNSVNIYLSQINGISFGEHDFLNFACFWDSLVTHFLEQRPLFCPSLKMQDCD